MSSFGFISIYFFQRLLFLCLIVFYKICDGKLLKFLQIFQVMNGFEESNFTFPLPHTIGISFLNREDQIVNILLMLLILWRLQHVFFSGTVRPQHLLHHMSGQMILLNGLFAVKQHNITLIITTWTWQTWRTRTKWQLSTWFVKSLATLVALASMACAASPPGNIAILFMATSMMMPLYVLR